MTTRVITLEGDDGRTYTARISGIIVLQGQKYAALTQVKKTSHDLLEQETSIIITRLIERDGLAVFQAIEDDEEYERVVTHIADLVVELVCEDEADETEKKLLNPDKRS